MNINQFPKNTVVTRIERSKNGDGSYMSDPLIFKGVSNGVIYLESGRQFEYPPIFSDRLHRKELPCKDWEDGWSKYNGVECDVKYNGVRLRIVERLIAVLYKIKFGLIKGGF